MREKQTQNARRVKIGGGIVNLKKNERLVCAGQMPLRAPNGELLSAVPVYKIAPADCSDGEELKPGERLIFAGVEESKATAEERYNALIAGEKLPKSHATPLYIKDADSADPETGLTESEKRALNPLVADLLCEFSAAMREREVLERQRKAANE